MFLAELNGPAAPKSEELFKVVDEVADGDADRDFDSKLRSLLCLSRLLMSSSQRIYCRQIVEGLFLRKRW
jgi:hypothetical protein